MEMQQYDLQAGARLVQALNAFARELTLGGGMLSHTSKEGDTQYRDARNAIVGALTATIRYMKKLEEGAASSPRTEAHLTTLWAKASDAVAPVDPTLAQACLMKGLGWADPKQWSRAKEIGLKISIEDMQAAHHALVRAGWETKMHTSVPKWFSIAGVAFASLTFVFLVYLILGPELPVNKKTPFNFLMAFSVAASSAFLGGDLAARGQVPIFQESPLSFSAYGGVAMLIVTYALLYVTH